MAHYNLTANAHQLIWFLTLRSNLHNVGFHEHHFWQLLAGVTMSDRTS